MMKFLVLGKGFVGDAVGNALWKKHEVIYHDPYKNKDLDYELPYAADVAGVVVCLPTPSNPDGNCDDSLILEYYLNIRKHHKELDILIKSTTSIETLKYLHSKQDRFLTFSPEFLVASNSRESFETSTFYVYSSCTPEGSNFWKSAFHGCVNPQAEIVYTPYLAEAGMMKYTINSFLATKVTFMNQVYKLHEKVMGDYEGASWENFTKLLSLDKRLGTSHMQVPGPDGKLGWGGACFPKDTSEYLIYSIKMKTPLNLLYQAILDNQKVREVE